MELYAAYINRDKAIFLLKQVKVLDETTLKVDSLWRFTEGDAATDCLLGLLDMDLILKSGVEYARYSKNKKSLIDWLEEKRKNYINEARNELQKLESSKIEDSSAVHKICENKQKKEKTRTFYDSSDCADCLCRVCARNGCNNSYIEKLDTPAEELCNCDCIPGNDYVIESEEDCDYFLPDQFHY